MKKNSHSCPQSQLLLMQFKYCDLAIMINLYSIKLLNESRHRVTATEHGVLRNIWSIEEDDKYGDVDELMHLITIKARPKKKRKA